MIDSYSQITKHHNNRNWELYLFSIVLFLLNPLASLICILNLIINGRWHSEDALNVWSILLALWISLFNATKIPESDQLMYQGWYVSAVDYTNLKTIFSYSGAVYKEPIYGLFQSVMHFVFNGNIHLFWISVSFIEYYLLFKSIEIILLNSQRDYKCVICGIICCAFFTQFFSLTLHLIRQMLAFSIILYAIALRCKDNKIHYIYFIIAPLIHTTSILFVLLALYKPIYHQLKKKQILFLAGILLALILGSIIVGSFMMSLIGENNSSSYLFRRMQQQSDEGNDFNILITFVLIIPLLIISIVNLKRLNKRHQFSSPLYPIIHLFLFLSLFVIGMSARPLIQYRFAFVTYYFIGFILPLLFNNKNKFNNTYYIAISSFFILRFFITFNNGTWNYAINITDILTWPVPLYFFSS